jgi:hypothetical protein
MMFAGRPEHCASTRSVSICVLAFFLSHGSRFLNSYVQSMGETAQLCSSDRCPPCGLPGSTLFFIVFSLSAGAGSCVSDSQITRCARTSGNNNNSNSSGSTGSYVFSTVLILEQKRKTVANACR